MERLDILQDCECLQREFREQRQVYDTHSGALRCDQDNHIGKAVIDNSSDRQAGSTGY